MRLFSEVRERVRALLFRAREEAELTEELRFHLEMETERLRGEGLGPREARRRAALAFGAVEKHKEEVREARGLGLLEDLARDLRFALRGFRLNPLFVVTLVLTLALGIGANAAMFSVVDALLLRPLPYGDPDELVKAMAINPVGGDAAPYFPRDTALVWSEQPGLFERVMMYVPASVLYTGGAEARTLAATAVSPDFEETLQVRPALGRGFVEEDAAPGADPVVVLSDGFWRTAFGADPGVIGETIELDGVRHRVVGVMPAGFKFPEYSRRELWLPLRRAGTVFGRPMETVNFLGRVGPGGVAVAQARAEALSLAFAEEGRRGFGWSLRLEPLDETRSTPELDRAVWFLAGAVGLLLLTALVNGVSLLLVRGWSRTRELAVRVALGASRRRVVRQLLTESVLLSLMSGVAAATLAWLSLRAISGIMPGSITFFAPHAIEVERRTLAFTFGLAALSGLVIGVLPALRAARRGSVVAGAGLTPYAKGTPARSRLRRALVVGEVAVSVVLLAGAGLMANSFVRLVTVDPGFRVEELAVMDVRLPSRRYPSPEGRTEVLRRLEERLEAVPGVEGVTVANGLPPQGAFHIPVTFETEDGPPVAGAQPRLLPFAEVPPDYFEVLEIPIVAGRAFTAEDAGTDRVVIDRDLARFLWPGASPLGRSFRIGPDDPWLTVVGVVADLKLNGPDDRMGRFEVLYPLEPDGLRGYVPLGIRTRGDPAPLLPEIRAAVHEVDPNIPIQELLPATVMYADSIDMPRFLLVLMAALSGLALLLAGVGVYGVLASGVAQRRHELAVRIALGARPGILSRRVAGEGLALAAVGAGLGVAGALALSSLVRELLFGVEPTDPATIAVVVAISLTVAVVACYRPARRAGRIDPAEALKTE